MNETTKTLADLTPEEMAAKIDAQRVSPETKKAMADRAENVRRLKRAGSTGIILAVY